MKRPAANIAQALRHDHAATASVIVLALCGAYALKSFYSQARFDDLSWILAPTVTLLGWITRATFELEPHQGYLSRDLLFQVVPSCAGVNFLIVAFTSLVCGLVFLQPTTFRKVMLLPLSAIAAYVTTIVANAARIAIGAWLHTAGISFGPLTPERLHHLEGTVVYFFFLCVLFAAALRWAGICPGACPPPQNRQTIRHRPLQAAKQILIVWIPLAVYVAVMVLAPLLNGAAWDGGFREHVPIAVMVPVLMTLLWVAIREKRRRLFGLLILAGWAIPSGCADDRIRREEQLIAQIDSLRAFIKSTRELRQDFEQRARPVVGEYQIRELQDKGLLNPLVDIAGDLRAHPELLPQEQAKPGARFGFYNAEGIHLLTTKWVLAEFEDGHMIGHMLLEFSVGDSGRIFWKPITWTIDRING